MAGESQTTQEASLEIGQMSEQVAEKIITQDHKESINNDIPSRTQQMLKRLLDGGYTIESILEGMKNSEIEPGMKSGLYNLWGKEIIRLLNEDVAKKRMMSARERYASSKKAQKEGSDNNSKSGRGKAKEVEEEETADGVAIQKMTLDEIGKELSQQEEQEKAQREEREKLEKEMQSERARHAKSYQYAFDFFSQAVALSGRENSARLVDLIKKLGNENFGVRQSAIDNLAMEQNVNAAFEALEAALKDKIIVHKAIQAISRTGEFRAVETLLDIIRDNPGAKESTVRGLAEQAVGEILLALHKDKKGSGIKNLYLLLKSQRYEKNLTVLITIVGRDIESLQMRKFYINNQCLKWLLFVGGKLIKHKKKKMKITFVTLALHTPLTKEINGVLKTIQGILKAA